MFLKSYLKIFLVESPWKFFDAFGSWCKPLRQKVLEWKTNMPGMELSALLWTCSIESLFKKIDIRELIKATTSEPLQWHKQHGKDQLEKDRRSLDSQASRHCVCCLDSTVYAYVLTRAYLCFTYVLPGPGKAAQQMQDRLTVFSLKETSNWWYVSFPSWLGQLHILSCCQLLKSLQQRYNLHVWGLRAFVIL